MPTEARLAAWSRGLGCPRTPSPPPSPERFPKPWAGEVPVNVSAWIAAEHRIICRVHGEQRECGRPDWDVGDDYFHANEEERRGLPMYALYPINARLDNRLLGVNVVPHSDVATEDYATGRHNTVEGVFFGSGEKLGDWNAYTLFVTTKDTKRVCNLAVGTWVEVGEAGYEVRGLVAALLGGKKKAGTAAEDRMQNCYLVVLLVGKEFKYAALTNVRNCEGGECRMDWGVPRSLCPAMADDSELESLRSAFQMFRPKSITAATRAASEFVKTTKAPKQDEDYESDTSMLGKRKAALGSEHSWRSESRKEDDSGEEDSEDLWP